MISRFAKITLLTMLTLILFNASVFGEEKDKKWVTLADNTQVYGYWQDTKGHWVLVECNPSTGEETGFAFLSSGEYKTAEKEVVDRYEYITKEERNRVKELRPVVVEKVFAPNAPTSVGVDEDYYYETGEIRMITKYSATWPGSTSPIIVPSLDPKRYLIVAAVTNPNPFPVKAKVNISLHNTNNPSGADLEVIFQANETRYVKVNDQYQNNIVYEWGGYSNGSWSNGYSKEYNTTNITENMDSELPQYLKPYYGWYDASDLAGNGDLSLWNPDVLSANSKIFFRICSSGNPYWTMEGSIYRDNNQWQIRGTCYPSAQTSLAETKIKSWINKNAPGFPTVRSYNNSITYPEDGIIIEGMYGSMAGITRGATANEWDLTGPIVLGYVGNKDVSSYEQNRIERPNYTLDDPAIAGWHKDMLPIVKMQPMFIAQYDFIPQEHPKVGYLKKIVTPGVYLKSSTISVPHFQENISYVSHNVSGTSVTVNYDVSIQAINDTNYDCTFSSDSDISFYLPKVRLFKNYVQYYNDVETRKPDYEIRGRPVWEWAPIWNNNNKRYFNPDITDSNFDKVNIGQQSITIPKQTNTTIYNQRKTVTFSLSRYKSLPSIFKDVKVISPFFTDSREAPFVSKGRMLFTLTPDDELLSIGLADMKYKKYNWSKDNRDSDYTEAKIGSNTGIDILSNIYKGFPLFTIDPFYSLLLKQGNKRYQLEFNTSGVKSLWPISFETNDPIGNPGVSPDFKDIYHNEAWLSSEWYHTSYWYSEK